MKLTALTKYLPVVLAIASFFTAQQTKAIETNPTPTVTPSGKATSRFECAYERCMKLGYAATESRDYENALSYFTLALLQRPGDLYARRAYANLTDYLKAEEAASDYESFMRSGYTATKRRHYQTALYFFKQALQERPRDKYARRAIQNVQTYINGSQETSTRAPV